MPYPNNWSAAPLSVHAPRYSRRYHTASLQSGLRAVLCQQGRSTACHTSSRQQPLCPHLGMPNPSADDPLNYLVLGTERANMHGNELISWKHPPISLENLQKPTGQTVCRLMMPQLSDMFTTICPSEQRYSNKWLEELAVHNMSIHHPSYSHKQLSFAHQTPWGWMKERKAIYMLPVRQTHKPQFTEVVFARLAESTMTNLLWRPATQKTWTPLWLLVRLLA